jgi:hypothetical protein
MATKRTIELDAPALAEIEAVLAQVDRYAGVLAETHQSIPLALTEERALAGEAGAAQISGIAGNGLAAKLAGVTARREGDVRRRAAAVNAILGMEAELKHARGLVSAKQAELAGAVITEFSGRWYRACGMLDTLRSEAAALAGALSCAVPVPAPYRISHSVAHDRAEIRPVAAGEAVEVTLPPELAAIKATAGRLNAAVGLCSGIRLCQQFDARHHALALQRGLPLEHRGVYTVREPFQNPVDGLQFQTGTLVDASVMSNGFLSRLLLTQKLHPVELAVVA